MPWDETLTKALDFGTQRPIRFLLFVIGLVGLALCLVSFLDFTTTVPFLKGFASLSTWEVRHTISLLLLILPFASLLFIVSREKKQLHEVSNGLSTLDNTMRDRLVTYYLRGLKETYLRDLARFSPNSQVRVRVNLMMPVDRTEVMKIFHCDYTGDFNQTELKNVWHKWEGKAGTAWADRKQVMYAADIESEDTQLQKMGDKPPEVALLKSVLSTPVLFNARVVAVINLDSNFGGKETFIREDFVHRIFSDGAQHIVPLISVVQASEVTH